VYPCIYAQYVIKLVVIDSSDNIPLGVKEVTATNLQSRFKKCMGTCFIRFLMRSETEEPEDRIWRSL
jgi:hypothetical protein